jgi:hypothetical protein
VEGITLNESNMLGVHAKVLALMSEPFLKRAVLDVDRSSRASVYLDSPFIPLLGKAIPD